MLQNKKVGFIGGGQMCEAIFAGALASGGLLPQNVYITDVNQGRLDFLQEKYGVVCVLNNETGTGFKQVAAEADIIVLAIKPQYARAILEKSAGYAKAGQLVVSIMGGFTIASVEEFFPNNPVLRVMPNTPMLVQKGVAGIVAGVNAAKEDCELGKQLFDLVGKSYFLTENLLNAQTVVSGCSPAFAYQFIEALSDGGVEHGLPREMAIQMAAQALSGAAEMVLQTGLHPAQLKDNVTSPGEAPLRVFMPWRKMVSAAQF